MISEIMIQAVLDSLQNVGIGLGLYLMAYIANMLFSTYYNIKMCGWSFDKTKFFNSILKAIVFIVGVAFLVTAITALPMFADVVGFTIPDEYLDVFSTLVIISIPLGAAIYYIKEAFLKMKNILLGNIDEADKYIEQAKDIIESFTDRQKEEVTGETGEANKDSTENTENNQ